MFFRNGRFKAVRMTSQRPDFFLFAPFSSCYILHFFRGNQNPTDGSDWRECMILFISTSIHSTSKQSDCTLSQGLHPSGHQHPDNIGITSWLCDLHSCNVLSTFMFVLFGTKVVYIRIWKIHTKCKYLILYVLSLFHVVIDPFIYFWYKELLWINFALFYMKIF